MRPSTFPIAAILFARSDSWVFHPTTEPEPSGRVRKVQHSMRMECTTGNLEIRGAFRYSDDGVTWDAAVDVDDQTRTTDGTTYGTTWCDVTSGQTRRRFLQRGFKVRRINSSTNTEICRAWQSWEDDSNG